MVDLANSAGVPNCFSLPRVDHTGAFFDGNPEGCHCTSECGFPCFQRVGLTTQPCCPDCAPLPEDDE